MRAACVAPCDRVVAGARSTMLAARRRRRRAATAHALIQGSGLDLVRRTRSTSGSPTWTPNGHAGRLHRRAARRRVARTSRYKTTDFAVTRDRLPGHRPDDRARPTPAAAAPYAYLPIVAGGTSFPYQIKVGGKLVAQPAAVRARRSPRSSPTRSPTGTTRRSPRTTTAASSRRSPIIPVVRSDGSGSTAQFTTWMDKQYPTIWRPFYGQAGLTEYYPRKGRTIAPERARTA